MASGKTCPADSSILLIEASSGQQLCSLNSTCLVQMISELHKHRRCEVALQAMLLTNHHASGPELGNLLVMLSHHS